MKKKYIFPYHSQRKRKKKQKTINSLPHRSSRRPRRRRPRPPLSPPPHMPRGNGRPRIRRSVLEGSGGRLCEGEGGAVEGGGAGGGGGGEGGGGLVDRGGRGVLGRGCDYIINYIERERTIGYGRRRSYGAVNERWREGKENIKLQLKERVRCSFVLEVIRVQCSAVQWTCLVLRPSAAPVPSRHPPALGGRGLGGEGSWGRVCEGGGGRRGGRRAWHWTAEFYFVTF